MKTKQALKLSIVVLILLLAGLNVEPDDKELFMGTSGGTTSVVKPNVVVLMDNSGSMNTIIYYPKNGPDSDPETLDDNGYNPNVVYSGSVEDLAGDTNYLDTTLWYGRWKVSDTSAEKFSTSDLTNYFGDGKSFWTGCYASSGTNKFQAGSNSQWFNVGDTVLFCDTSSPYNDARATITAKTTDAGGNPWLTLSNIVGGPITVNEGHFQKRPTGKTWTAEIVKLYATTEGAEKVRYPKNYINWMFFTANDTMRTAISHFSTYGTFDVTKTPGTELSNCATPGNNDLSKSGARIKKVFTRIQTAREVVCKVSGEANKTVKLGLFNFNYDDGGTLEQGLNDMSDESSELVSYKNNVWDIGGTAWTPLAEAMTDIWFYYKPGPTSKTLWPVDYEIEHNTVNHSTSAATVPVDWWCQNNYIVIMTDGESTKDGFDSTRFSTSIFKSRPVKYDTTKSYGTGHWTDNGWGDPDNNDASSGIPTNYNINSTYCPNYTCWLRLNDGGGTDYLDDVAYFLRHQDMFPDSFWGTHPATGWPGDQCIYTYVIGFAADNNMLQQTAINGDGGYYTANNFDELVNAFQLVITSINLRNYAFSSITAPKKSTTATNDELTYSYVGYFMPSGAAGLWEGHLLAFKLMDLWGFDDDGNGKVGPEEYVYNTELQCVSAGNGKECERWVYLDIGHEWDAADKMPDDRNLYTAKSSALSTNIAFDVSNVGELKNLFELTTTDDLTKTEQATQIIESINQPKLRDIFHSDVSFVGDPPAGKQYLPNIDPPGSSDEKFATFYNNHMNRTKVLYAGTNDGIMHMFYAGGVNAGKEIWGFLPDEILPSLKKFIIDVPPAHTYTVDGRITPEDVYFEQDGRNSWSTILCFGLRAGGNAYYALDISDVSTQPKALWKFKDVSWSGQSWGEPVVARVMINNPDASGAIIQKWVAFLSGGFGFNNENPNDKKGKAIFMVDAGTGELLWMLGYDSTITYTGSAPAEGILRTAESGIRLLTKEDVFNFSIPASLTAVDKDSNGFIDTLYYGNKGGHLFKTDITNSDPLQWTTSILFQTVITTKATATISTITPLLPGKYDILLGSSAANAGFAKGDGIKGNTSYATGYIVDLDQKTITVNVTSGAFQAGETVVTRTYNPIYLAPAAMYDKCYTPWVCFGTGDRDRPRSNTNKGNFVLFKDNGTYLHKVDNPFTTGANETSKLLDVSALWTGTDKDTLPKSTLTSTVNGWCFTFPDTGEKLFDPDIVVLPDQNFNPIIYLNTYQPPAAWVKTNENPCDVPSEGTMNLYQLFLGCGVGNDITGTTRTGRIAGGGIYSGKEYIMYEGTDGQVASVPGGDSGEDSNLGTHTMTLEYPGGVVFWLEKKK